MSRATMKTKYRILKGFDNQRDAQKLFDSLGSELLKTCCKFSIKMRKWGGKDKRRYYVRELIRKGTKK